MVAVGLRGGDDLLPLNFNMENDEFQPFPTGNGEPSEWLIAQLNPASDYVGAVVIENAGNITQVSHIDYDAYNFF